MWQHRPKNKIVRITMSIYIGSTFGANSQPQMIRYNVEFHINRKPSGFAFEMYWDKRNGSPTMKNVIDYLKEMDYGAYAGLNTDDVQYEVYAEEK